MSDEWINKTVERIKGSDKTKQEQQSYLLHRASQIGQHQDKLLPICKRSSTKPSLNSMNGLQKRSDVSTSNLAMTRLKSTAQTNSSLGLIQTLRNMN